MTLRTKVLFSLYFIWGSYLLLVWTGFSLFTSKYLLLSLIVLGIIFAGLTLMCFNILVFNRLEKLNKNINQVIRENVFTHRINEIGSDELSSITHGFNQILETTEYSNQKLKACLEEQKKELQEHTTQLQQEIAEYKLLEKEFINHKEHLVKLAHYDNLTDLPNRVFFNEMLNKTLNHANRYKKMMAILFIDLDRFKNINDVFGHPIGDNVLKEVASRFSTVLRSGDILARLGGDEFIILLNDIGHEKFASPIAEKLLQSCSKPIKIGNQLSTLAASIGISIYPTDGTSLEDLQRNADIAMYKAKHAGGNVYCYFKKQMDEKSHENLHMEEALQKAIQQDEFTLYYQPKLNLKEGNITGVEALLRWENPELGMISPDIFIPLAEQMDLMIPIGEWVLREACQTCKAWQLEGYQPVSVAVNLSAKQFHYPDLEEIITNILTEMGLEPHYLELEIAETVIMENVESSIHKLNALKKIGVHISIDDFGTGYTSISYLKKFPIRSFKIDKIFIKEIPTNSNDAIITNAFIGLAHALEIKVVAEGVETAEQLQYLADKNCDIVQGYYLSRPLPKQKIVLQFSKIQNVEDEMSL